MLEMAVGFDTFFWQEHFFPLLWYPFPLKVSSRPREPDPLCVWSLLKMSTAWPIKDCASAGHRGTDFPLPWGQSPNDTPDFVAWFQPIWMVISILATLHPHCVHPTLRQSLMRPCSLRPQVRLHFWLESHILSAVLRWRCPEGVPQAAFPHWFLQEG